MINKKYLQEYPLLLVLIIAAFLFLMSLNTTAHFTFDGTVYIGIAKIFSTFGQSGLYEHIRPPVYPLVLVPIITLSSIFQFSPIIATLVIQTIIYFLDIILCYLICRRIIKVDAHISAFCTAGLLLSSQIIFTATAVMAELLALSFFLGSIWLIYKKKYLFAGILIGLAVLTKYFYAIFILIIIALILIYTYEKKHNFSKDKNNSNNVKNAAFFATGCAIPIGLYLIILSFFFANPLQPIIDAQFVATHAVWCTQIARIPFNVFSLNMIGESLFSIVAWIVIIFGFIRYCFKKNLINLAYITAVIVPFLLVATHPCTDQRYVIFTLIPLFGVCALYLKKITETLVHTRPRITKKIIILMLILLLAGQIYLFTHETLDKRAERQTLNSFGEVYKNLCVIIGTENVDVASTTPFLAAYSNARNFPLYYPLFNSTLVSNFQEIISRTHTKYVLLDDCTGDMFCPREDVLCPTLRQQFIDSLSIEFSIAYSKSFEIYSTQKCTITLYKKIV